MTRKDGNNRMATYDHKQVFADYANDRITPEMAVGHALQHIDKLYEALAMVNTSRTLEQTKIDALEKHVHTLQATIDNLTARKATEPPMRKPSAPRSPK